MAATLSHADRERFFRRALLAADWYVNSQLGGPRADWNADTGRFLYYYFLPDGRYVPGINWTQGRGLFVLSEAYKLTGEERYRRSAELAVRYVAALQVMDPYYGEVVGAIKEQTPQGGWGGALDGAQAASGLLMYEKVTGQADALRRARAFCDYILRHFSPEEGMPGSAYFYPEVKVVHGTGYSARAIGQATAIPLWHLYRRTGEKKYLEPVLYGADLILACQRPDGAFYNCTDISGKEPPRPDHHEGRGEGDDRFLLRNDDGMMVVVLAAHQVTGEKKYLDAAVAYADWIVANEPHERPYCGFPVQANNVLDIGRAAGRDYLPWVLDHLEKHLLRLQVLDEGADPRARGGFRGEDEQDEGGIFGGSSLDYVVQRVTCYAAGTLFRLSGRGTGAGFSVWGLDYRPRLQGRGRPCLY